MLKSNEGRIAGMSVTMETKVICVNARWVLQFKTASMMTPSSWHYNTEQEATAAEKRLNRSIRRAA